MSADCGKSQGVKLRWKILIGLAAVIGVAALWLTITHYQAKSRVEAYRQKLISQGEKLTISELIPKPAKQDDNGASELLAAGIQLGIASSNYLPLATAMASGHSRVSWQQAVLPTEDAADVWPGLDAELNSKQESLSAARKALESPTLSFPIAYEQGLAVLLPHLATVKKAELCLAFDSVANLHKGNVSESQADLLACVTLVRHLAKDEPLEISQLVRIASGNIAASATWEALQSPSWKEEQLFELQKAWDSFSFLDNLENTLAMERAYGQQGFDAARGSFSTVQAYSNLGAATTGQGSLDELTELGKGLVEDPVGGFKAIIDRYPRYWAWKGWWSYDEELCWLEMHQLAIQAVREAHKREGMVISTMELRSKLDDLFKSHPHAEKRFLLGLGDSSSTNFLIKINSAETVRRLIVTDIALKRFQLKMQSYPNDLKQLVPQCIASVPIDPMDGKPLRYRLNPDGTFLLYSVGENGVDDNGDSSEILKSASPKPRRFSIWYKRRDAVWPQPATTEEVRAYHQVVGESRVEYRRGVRNSSSPAQNTNVAANLLQSLQQYGVTNPIPAKTN
jgi:hypothetical protein